MDPAPMIEALGRARPDGCAVREWSLFVTESTGLSLGIKDRQAGNAHTPLSVSETSVVSPAATFTDVSVADTPVPVTSTKTS